MFASSSVTLFALGVALVLIMPGPTNTLLATAGFEYGLKRWPRFTAAELAGYFVSITLWGCFLGRAAVALPWLPSTVRLASSVYMAYLAIRMWRVALALPTSGQKAIGLRTLLLATLLNPKAILFAGGIFPVAAFASVTAWCAAMAIFTLLLVPCAFVWIAFGAGLGSGRLRWVNPVQVQRGASIVLGMFSMSLAWTALH